MNTPTDQRSQVLEKTSIPCLYRSAGSGIFYGIFTRSGRQIKKSLKIIDKELACQRLEDLRQIVAKLNTKEGGEIAFATHDPETHILCGGLAKVWLERFGPRMKRSSQVRRVSAINALASYFTKTVRSITWGQVESWAAARMGSAAARTFNIERETLIQVLDYAVREDLILENPARGVPRRKQPKPQIVIPTKEQFKSLLAALRQMDVRYHDAADLCELLAYSGCRLREATAMVWGDVDFKSRTFVVSGGERRTKNQKARSVPLFPALEKLLLRLQSTLPHPPLPPARIVAINDAKNAITSVCAKAGLPHLHHHALRHFFCSNATEAGVDFSVIAGWLGHKDGGVLVAKTYGHLRDEDELGAAMAEKMTFDALVLGRSTSFRAASKSRFTSFGECLHSFGSGHGAIGHRDLPVGVVCVDSLHGADHLLAECRFDQVALAAPDFELNADKIPTAARCRSDSPNHRLA